MTPRVEVFDDRSRLADAAAGVIAEAARGAVRVRGRCFLALSGGSTPRPMLRRLATEDVDWERVDLFQVDERLAPDGDPARNLTLISELVARIAAQPPAVHPMPVTLPDPDEAAAVYEHELESVCGATPRMDVVHLGLGADGHTASLVPGDPVLEVQDRWVAATRPYEGHRRLTLTYPTLALARLVVFVVAGGEKAAALQRVLEGDPSMPAARIRAGEVLFLVDAEARGP